MLNSWSSEATSRASAAYSASRELETDVAAAADAEFFKLGDAVAMSLICPLAVVADRAAQSKANGIGKWHPRRM